MGKLLTTCVIKSDYDILKKNYGEQFARFCRSTFATILEKPGLLADVITKNFVPTHSLGEDVQNHDFLTSFKNFVFCAYHHKKNALASTGKTPEELLAKVGYTLYPECQSEADLQRFKSYYEPNEVLCSFNNNRLLNCRVWFAVKNDVDKIKRPNIPNRQDEYGTSVISIQFTKEKKQDLSIKNRYNHTVYNPDATFSNNLDNIIPGLTNAFKEYYHCFDYNYENQIEIPGYIKADDGKFYRENFEINGSVHFCENNAIVCDGLVKTFDSHSQILAENYLFDFQQNKVENVYLRRGINNLQFYAQRDAFTESLGKIDKMQVVNDKQNKKRKILVYSEKNPEPKIVWINQHNEIVGYQNHEIGYLEDSFLLHNRALKFLDVPNVKTIDEFFLIRNRAMKELSLPNLQSCCNCFLIENNILDKFYAPKLTKIGMYFMFNNTCLKPQNFVTGEIAKAKNLDHLSEGFENSPYHEQFRALLIKGYKLLEPERH